MDKNSKNGQISVATIAKFNEIIANVGVISTELMRYHLQKYGYMELGDGLYLNAPDDDDKVLRLHYPNGNWRNVVKNHSVGTRCNWNFIKEQVQHIVCTHYNVPDPKSFPTFNDWAENLYEYGFCNSEKRMAKIRTMFDPININFK